MRFDEKISPHELRAMQERMSESDDEDSDFDVNMAEGQLQNNRHNNFFKEVIVDTQISMMELL